MPRASPKVSYPDILVLLLPEGSSRGAFLPGPGLKWLHAATSPGTAHLPRARCSGKVPRVINPGSKGRRQPELWKNGCAGCGAGNSRDQVGRKEEDEEWRWQLLSLPWDGPGHRGLGLLPRTVVSSLPEPPTGELQGGQLSGTLGEPDLGVWDLLAIMNLSACCTRTLGFAGVQCLTLV